MGDQSGTEIVPSNNERSVGEGILNNEINAERERYQPTAAEKIFSTLKALMMRAMILYAITQLFQRPNSNSSNPGGSTSTKLPATNLFKEGQEYDVYVYLSEIESLYDFDTSMSLVWKKEGLIYGDWFSGINEDGSYTYTTSFDTSPSLRNNGSLYLHSFFVRSGKSPNPKDGKELFSKKWTIHSVKELTKYRKKMYKKTTNLLTGETEASLEDQAKAKSGIKEEIFSHWHPNITINFVTDFKPWVPGQIPAPLNEFFEFTPTFENYKPVVFVNDFWNLNKDYTILNDTVKSLNFSVTIQPMSMFKWQMYCSYQMRNNYNVMANIMGDDDDDDKDQDSIKEALLETSIYLLVLTVAVSILHSVFEIFAFKNDIQFWNNRKTLEGLSVRSVFFNVFQSLIVMLYVFDNDTNAMIKFSCVIGLGIEIWKINKVLDISIDPERKFLGIFPRLVYKDKSTYEDSGTKEYDRLAFKYLGMVLFPVGIAFSVYTVIYNEHKGWYSFTLGTIYGFLLTFGFIMMTPQLFINYKLKSVAHLPWRMMTYKALNTFIDDIFAFVIKMPTAYRIGCFRDDIIFFIFLYQRYIYRVDLTRVNEFGYSGEMENSLEDKDQKIPMIKDENQGLQKEKSLQMKKED